MAAGLQSFQSNDKQMQAIRELTNEVFNLKQKQAIDEAANDSKFTEINTKIQALHPNYKYKQCYATGLNYVIAGGAVIRQSISAAPSTGYKLKSAALRFAGQEGSPSIAPVVCFYSFPTDESTAINFGLINTGSTSVTVTGVYFDCIEEEITA